MASMMVHAYRVEERGGLTLDALLAQIERVSLEERGFQGSQDLRLEYVGHAGELWYASFAAPRQGHGPGRMSAQQRLGTINLEDGENFGEDTSLLYDARSKYLIAQYNHYGPRIQSISKYLAAAHLRLYGVDPGEGPALDRAGFRIGAVLKPDAYARLRRWGIYKQLDIEISVPGVHENDLVAGRSLASVLRAPLPAGVETITIGMTAQAGRDGLLGEHGVRGIMNEVEQLGAAVKRAVVRGKPTLEDKMDAVNLVSDRLSTRVQVQLGQGLRYTIHDIWTALQDVFLEWSEDGSITIAVR